MLLRCICFCRVACCACVVFPVSEHALSHSLAPLRRRGCVAVCSPKFIQDSPHPIPSVSGSTYLFQISVQLFVEPGTVRCWGPSKIHGAHQMASLVMFGFESDVQLSCDPQMNLVLVTKRLQCRSRPVAAFVRLRMSSIVHKAWPQRRTLEYIGSFLTLGSASTS